MKAGGAAPSTPAGSDPTAPCETRLLSVRAERVVGEAAPPTPDHRAAPATLASLVGFAETLVLAGTAAAGQDATPFDVKTVSLASRPARRLVGEAQVQPAPPGLSVWLVTITDDDDQPIATLVLSYALGAGAVPQEAPADGKAPPPPGRAAPETVETPLDRILAAATDVIARKGFAQATMREIAEATGMHVPTLYAHVKGKDDLLELVYAHEMDRLAAGFEHLAAGASATERVRQMMTVALAVSVERRREIGILNRELKSLRPEARARMIARYRALVGRYETVIREGVATGEFRDIDPLVAANFLDMIGDIWALRPFFFSEITLDLYRDAAIAFAFEGLARR